MLNEFRYTVNLISTRSVPLNQQALCLSYHTSFPLHLMPVLIHNINYAAILAWSLSETYVLIEHHVYNINIKWIKTKNPFW